MTETVFYILSILCIVYGVIVMGAGTGTSFFVVWFGLGIVMLCAGLGMHFHLWNLLPPILRRVTLFCFGSFLILFLGVESCILGQFSSPEEKDLDYIIVLGAYVTENGPQPVLVYRLDKACSYLEKNPHTMCILSGGQGHNEPWSEAQGMQSYMIKKGIDPSRLILEDQSQNTSQNLLYSSRLFDKEKADVGIVTNDFHIFRSIHLARKLDIRHVSGIAAGSNRKFLINNLLREFLAVCKDFLAGNLK